MMSKAVTCAAGFSKVCPMKGDTCPDDMEQVCPMMPAAGRNMGGNGNAYGKDKGWKEKDYI